MSETHTFEDLLARDGCLAYTNKGVSMMPLLRQDRDLMLIRARGEGPLQPLDAVLYRRPGRDGQAAYVLHRILCVNPDGSYWIIGDNCLTGETVPDAWVLGVLTGVVRDGKTLSVTNWSYRLYVNTWCRFYRLRIGILRLRAQALRSLRWLKRRLRPR